MLPCLTKQKWLPEQRTEKSNRNIVLGCPKQQKRMPKQRTELGKFDDHSIVEIPSDMCHESKDDVVDEVFDDFEFNIGDKS